MSQSYTAEFKAQVIHEVQETQNATIVARRHQLSPSMVRRWSREVRQDTGKSSEGLSLAEENAQLKRLVIDRDLQIAVLQDALRKKGIHP
jgi:transposase-like protein